MNYDIDYTLNALKSSISLVSQYKFSSFPCMNKDQNQYLPGLSYKSKFSTRKPCSKTTVSVTNIQGIFKAYTFRFLSVTKVLRSPKTCSAVRPID